MCATLINHGERLIVPSGHYMHSLIDAVNELPVLTYNATTAWPRARRPGPGVGSGRTAVLHRMVHYAWDRSGGWGASVRAHVLACGGVRACVRETVCAITFVSVFLERCSSWSRDRRWASRFWKTGWRDKRQEVGRFGCRQQLLCTLCSRRKLKRQDGQSYILPPPSFSAPLSFSTRQNAGMKNTKQEITWED